MKDANSIIDSFANLKVLVAGDVLLDRFHYGAVERISPEAPVPVFRPVRLVEVPGGAGNTALNLASLGCKVRLVGRTGKDSCGARLETLFRAEKKIAAGFLRQADCPTIAKTRLVSSGNHILRVDEERIVPLSDKDAANVVKTVKRHIEACDIVVLSDYAKGFLTPACTRRIIAAAAKCGKMVVVDPKGKDYGKYAGATLVKPNLKEFSEATGKTFNPASEDFRPGLIRAARDFLKETGIGSLLITLGEQGMLYVPSENPVAGAKYLPTRTKEVFDVSGAGDTAIAALAAALAAGAPMADAMQIANAAAGVVVSKVGTATVAAAELKAALSDAAGDPLRKVLPVDALKRELARLKRSGKKIGFTNGCFDCCHLGHLTSLKAAKRLCDILVVGVNTDAWIRKHKGKGRPVQDEATRLALLASLEYVDYVVPFGEETALPLVKKLRPQVIAKEGYALADWPEGRFVESIGGTAVALKRVEGYSTTAIVERLAKQ